MVTSEIEEQVRSKGGKKNFQFDNRPTQKPSSQPDLIQIDPTSHSSKAKFGLIFSSQ